MSCWWGMIEGGLLVNHFELYLKLNVLNSGFPPMMQCPWGAIPAQAKILSLQRWSSAFAGVTAPGGKIFLQ